MQLPNGNRCSKPAIYPANWNTARASVKVPWYIHYRFYSAEYPEGRKIKVIKNINQYDDRLARKEIAERILKDVVGSLLNGFNPVQKEVVAPINYALDINPKTGLAISLKYAFDKLIAEPATKNDVENVLEHFTKALRYLKFDSMPLELVKKKIVRLTLDRVGETKGKKWTANNFNHYRKYISMLFTQLIGIDAIEFNPVSGIQKMSTVKKVRKTLTEEERVKVDSYLKPRYYTFWRYLQLFYHSGSRSSELLRVQGKDVDLKNQLFKRTIVKGKNRREVETIIPDVALSLWQEIMATCGSDDFVFSTALKPGRKPIKYYQITKRWYRLVKGVPDLDNPGKLKGGIGITADFYSVKHSASDDVAKKLSLKHVQNHNAHSSEATTRIYAVNQRERENKELKALKNSFLPVGEN